MKILERTVLADTEGPRVMRIKVSSPHIALSAKPGQFVVLMVDEKGERVPLTIVETDAKRGAIDLIFQEAGLTTKLLGKLNVGNALYALVGPLGYPSEIKNYGNVILVGGGVGIAEIYPVAKALKAAGNHIDTILGARTKALLILEKELKDVSDKLHIITDDGSYCRKGFVTDILKELLRSAPGAMRYALVYAVGPILMMKNVALTTKEYGVQTVVSLNSLMVDGTGMCGCCRVTVDGKTKFSCIDGPEFDAQSVDWVELQKRNSVYEEKEKHVCRLYKL